MSLLRHAMVGLAVVLALGAQPARSVASGLTAAEHDDPDVPAYSIDVSDDGLALTVTGGIRFGLAQDIRSALEGWPKVRVIILNSPGGRLGAAEDVARLIEERGLDTFVENDCESACTRVFVAGKNRRLFEKATLGFHGAALTDHIIGEGLVRWIANQATVAQYVNDGVDRAFMERAVSVAPASMWFPTHDQLFAAHVITAVVRSDGQLIEPPDIVAHLGAGMPAPPPAPPAPPR